MKIVPGDRQRARIVLLAAEGMASREIGREVGCTTGTASKWRVGYATNRMAGLDETGNRGAKPKYTAETDKRALAVLDRLVPAGYVRGTGGSSRRHFTSFGFRQNKCVSPSNIEWASLRAGVASFACRTTYVRHDRRWARLSTRARIEAMSVRLGMNKGRLTSLVRLSYLAPNIVRATLERRQPIELTPTGLLRLRKDLPHDWEEQRRFLGFPA
jgi:Homeodomain-like domain